MQVRKPILVTTWSSVQAIGDDVPILLSSLCNSRYFPYFVLGFLYDPRKREEKEKDKQCYDELCQARLFLFIPNEEHCQLNLTSSCDYFALCTDNPYVCNQGASLISRIVFLNSIKREIKYFVFYFKIEYILNYFLLTRTSANFKEYNLFDERINNG